MNDRDLFALALGLTKPWFVSSVELDADQKKLESSIDFERGSEFRAPSAEWLDARHTTPNSGGGGISTSSNTRHT